MQSKKESLVETATQIISDIAGNVFIAAPLAYYLYDIKLEAIKTIFIVMLIYNFGKTYAIRRMYQTKYFKKIKSYTLSRYDKIQAKFL